MLAPCLRGLAFRPHASALRISTIRIISRLSPRRQDNIFPLPIKKYAVSVLPCKHVELTLFVAHLVAFLSMSATAPPAPPFGHGSSLCVTPTHPHSLSGGWQIPAPPVPLFVRGALLSVIPTHPQPLSNPAPPSSVQYAFPQEKSPFLVTGDFNRPVATFLPFPLFPNASGRGIMISERRP